MNDPLISELPWRDFEQRSLSAKALRLEDGVSTNELLWFSICWILFVLLANYQAFAAIVLFVPFVIMPRKASILLIAFSSIVILKILLGYLFKAPYGYEFYTPNLEAGAREIFSVLLSFECFLLGYFYFDRKFFNDLSCNFLLMLCIFNIVIHDFASGRLFSATFDSPQIISLFSIFIILSSNKAKIISKIAAMIILTYMNLRFGSSYTAITTIVILVILTFKGVLKRKTLSLRVVFICLVIFFSIASLFAYAVNLRVEGNNGVARAELAIAAWTAARDSLPFGTPIFLPIVPIYAVDNLGWDQYLTLSSDEKFNLYALSFHNSILYLISRFGIFSLVLFGVVFKAIKRNVTWADALFTSAVFLGMCANVALESVRAGPGVAIVLGALFSVSRSKVRYVNQMTDAVTKQLN